MSPPEKVIRHILADELAVENELDYTPAEALGHLLEVAKWDVDEITVLIKATFQHDGVPMWIPPQEITEGLKAKYGSTFHRGSRGFVEIALDDIEDEPAHIGKELSVMQEKHSQALGQTERHESVWETQEKIILRVLGEEKRSFLRTGRAKMKTLATEGPEELVSTFRIGALYAGDSLGIVAAGDEVLDHLCDPFQAEASVYEGILFLIAVGKVLEVLFEDGLKDIRSALSICRGRIRIEVKR